MNKTINRFKEPSTWAGLGILAALFGANVAPEQINQVGGGVMALLAIFLPESGG